MYKKLIGTIIFVILFFPTSYCQKFTLTSESQSIYITNDNLLSGTKIKDTYSRCHIDFYDDHVTIRGFNEPFINRFYFGEKEFGDKIYITSYQNGCFIEMLMEDDDNLYFLIRSLTNQTHNKLYQFKIQSLTTNY